MLDILYEDNHLLAVNKPAMLPTMGVEADRPSLLALAKEYLARKYHKLGNVYLGIVSRLDAPVTGVVLMARTSKAAGRLSELFREHDIEKQYWALVASTVPHGVVEPTAGRLVHYLRKDERHRRMHITLANAANAQRAELSYRTLRGESNGTLLEIALHTGRKHQIRVQLADAGWPILGDRKYGSPRAFPSGIALHSRQLTFEHPVRYTPLSIAAPLPLSWRGFVTQVD
jgi:23S rRNA pseudouridine1911/1915/1917 synthase